MSQLVHGLFVHVSLSQLAAHLQTCTYSDTSRASERSQRTDAQLKAQKSAEQEGARRLRDESGIALARAAARVARKKGLAPKRKSPYKQRNS